MGICRTTISKASSSARIVRSPLRTFPSLAASMPVRRESSTSVMPCASFIWLAAPRICCSRVWQFFMMGSLRFLTTGHQESPHRLLDVRPHQDNDCGVAKVKSSYIGSKAFQFEIFFFRFESTTEFTARLLVQKNAEARTLRGLRNRIFRPLEGMTLADGSTSPFRFLFACNPG